MMFVEGGGATILCRDYRLIDVTRLGPYHDCKRTSADVMRKASNRYEIFSVEQMDLYGMCAHVLCPAATIRKTDINLGLHVLRPSRYGGRARHDGGGEHVISVARLQVYAQ